MPALLPNQTNDWRGGLDVLQCNEGGKFCCRKASGQDNCCSNKSTVMTVNVGQLRLETRTRTGSAPKTNRLVVSGAVGGVLGAALLASLAALAVMCMRRPK
ncbi:hypothetical protein G6O67_000038 [Ophiocordyceps sinensis]|uniref:Uncharacterized protein n=1 Tax=Ophiocordyceps sinensis TaxID=72228 RepID=A0A8H4V9C2_9HYPO|nr:hypothetical protein G6O67_000038 [Ophiocordyceps sinensis]